MAHYAEPAGGSYFSNTLNGTLVRESFIEHL